MKHCIYLFLILNALCLSNGMASDKDPNETQEKQEVQRPKSIDIIREIIKGNK